MARFDVALAWGSVSCLAWEPAGEAAGDVVLLHGGGLDSAELSWGALGPALADSGYRVFAPDHPGYGQSPPAPWPATQERLVEYASEVVTALGLSSYVMGGLSLGGGMTLGHVIERPPGVRAALLFGAYGLMDRQFTGRLAGLAHGLTWATLHTGLLGAIMRGSARSRRLMEASLGNALRNPAARTPELVDTLMAAATPTSFDAFEQWQRDQFGPRFLRTNYSDRLADIDVPILFVHGQRDAGVPVRCVEDAAARVAGGELLVVPDAGHWVQCDHPEIVTPAVRAFLQKLPPT